MPKKNPNPTQNKWHSHIITAQPDMFPGSLGYSLAARARENNIWDYTTHNIHDFGTGAHHKIDDSPYGGGAGLIMRPDIAAAALDSVVALASSSGADYPILMPSPRGVPFTQSRAKTLAAGAGVIFLCTRFEGIDERLMQIRPPESPIIEVSLGDYILSGGEAAALIILDTTIRLLAGVMGSAQSADDESFEGGLLEHPHYTKPQIWQGAEVPEVLRSGNHEQIAAWRKAQAEHATRSRRPDLWAAYNDDKKET